MKQYFRQFLVISDVYQVLQTLKQYFRFYKDTFYLQSKTQWKFFCLKNLTNVNFKIATLTIFVEAQPVQHSSTFYFVFFLFFFVCRLTLTHHRYTNSCMASHYQALFVKFETARQKKYTCSEIRRVTLSISYQFANICCNRNAKKNV